MLKGIVIHGDGVGKRLGYPTANLDIKKEKIKLSPGVYAARAVLNGKKYNASLVIQSVSARLGELRRTRVFKVEVHLLDYVGENFYGASLEVAPMEKVSDVMPFETEEKLKKKISSDVNKIKKILE